MWSLLQSHLSLPLLTQAATRPQCTLDVGLHGAPVLPLMAVTDTAAAASGADSDAPRHPSVSMINQRQRMPWFAAANIACVQTASPQLHPMFFAERQAQATLSAEASSSAAQAVGARPARKAVRRSRAAGAAAGMDSEPLDDDPMMPHIAAASSASALVSPAVADSALSVADQLAYFQRHICSKRFASNVPVSMPLEAGASTTERASADDFDREPLNDVSDDLITQLLQEDAQLRLRERNEDLTQDRLVTLQTHWPDRIPRPAAAASSDASSRVLSFALFPAGALMEELALAELSFHSLGSGALSSPQLSVTQLCSMPLDSPIRQVCLTAPVPAPPDLSLRRGAQPMSAAAAALPLIVSRTCQQMYVHTIRLQSPAVAAASSDAAPGASLLALDSHCFPSPIVHMASNASIPSEVAFLLQDGSIWLWNMQELNYDLLSNLQSPAAGTAAAAAAEVPKTTQRRFTVIPASRYWSPSFGSHLLQLPLAWGRIQFAPHARSILLVLPQAVLQIDVRAPYTGSAKVPRGKFLPIPALALAHDTVSAALTETAPGPIFPRLHAASISPRCPFHLLLVSSDFLMLLDLRSPGAAMIEWRHHQSGEPPTEIEWLDADDERSAASACGECTERDQFFVTHNRSRNEVTLYHFATRTIQHQQQQQPITSTFFSRFSPLRLQSIVHAEQRQSADSAPASDQPNPLVGLRVLRDPRVDPRIGLFHVLQLSEYGALVSQSFQHRHGDRSGATNSTVVSVKIPKAVEAEIAQQQRQQQLQQAAAARKRSRNDDEDSESDLGEQKHSESDADSDRMPPPSPRMPRGVPLSASKRTGLNVLLPAPSTPLSLTRASSLPLAASPSPHSSPPSLAALLAAPEKYERPWVQPHEIKPHRAVNLTAMLQSLAPEGKAAATNKESSGGSSLARAPSAGAPTTFAHLVALLIPALNDAQQAVQLFLSLPKTLHELAKFLLDSRIIPAGVLQAIAHEVSSESKNAAAAAAATIPSREITPRGMHALAQLLSETMHAFLHAAHGDDRPTHVPYHRDRWDALLPSLLLASAAPRLTPSSAAIRKRRRKFSGSGSVSARSDGESDAGAESDSSSRRSVSQQRQQLAPMPLNPFSASFPQPAFNVSHVHLALNRFAEAAAEPVASAAASVACTCGHASARASACCCVPLCSSFHCMRLHSTLYSLAPSILCTAWPADRMDRSADDADAEAQQQLDDGSFPPLPSQPSAASAAAAGGTGAGSFLTPAKHASFLGAGATRRQTLGPVVDLSQDISFLLSQGTQPIAEEEEQPSEQQQPEETEDKKNRDMQHALSSFMHQQQRQPSASIQTLTQSSSASAEEMPPAQEDEDAAAAEAPPPANPHGLRDMLCGMGESWRQFAELMHDAAAQQQQQQQSSSASSSSAAADAAAADDASAALASRFSDLSEWNASLFRGWLVSHELAVDPAALAAQQAEIGEDMRGATMDTMEDQGGRDED